MRKPGIHTQNALLHTFFLYCLRYPIIDLLHKLEIYNCPINDLPIQLFIFNTVCALGHHRNSIYATNINFGF